MCVTHHLFTEARSDACRFSVHLSAVQKKPSIPHDYIDKKGPKSVWIVCWIFVGFFFIHGFPGIKVRERPKRQELHLMNAFHVKSHHVKTFRKCCSCCCCPSCWIVSFLLAIPSNSKTGPATTIFTVCVLCVTLVT